MTKITRVNVQSLWMSGENEINCAGGLKKEGTRTLRSAAHRELQMQ